jgi:hypothetical protein
MPFGRGQENDFSTRQMALKSHFLSFAKLKLHIQRGRKIVNISVLLPFRYNILPLVKMKKGIGAYRRRYFRMFHDSENSFLAFVPSKYGNLAEEERAIFKLIAYPS